MQGDAKFAFLLEKMGCTVKQARPRPHAPGHCTRARSDVARTHTLHVHKRTHKRTRSGIARASARRYKRIDWTCRRTRASSTAAITMATANALSHPLSQPPPTPLPPPPSPLPPIPPLIPSPPRPREQDASGTTVTGPPAGTLKSPGEVDMEPMTDAFMTAAVRSPRSPRARASAPSTPL